ncbi:unnamed protein product [Durusdinium trenchii]|uniref:Uncharacterized protein n=2 Tax=Durusdinium trenchii TaxID=1381693 RepID=A0ABP0M2S7_9DINO
MLPVAVGSLLASGVVLIWACLEAKRVIKTFSAWQAGAALPNVNDSHGACPCDCQRGSNDDELSRQDHCQEGDTCFYGNGWCSRTIPDYATSSSSAQPVRGSCMKKRCNGPRGADSFNITCDRAKEPPFAVDWLVKHFGSQVRELLKDGAAGVNQHLNAPGGSIDASGFHGFELLVSDDLIDTLQVDLSRLSIVWRIGCWPPARYVVVGGSLRVRSGWVRLTAAGVTLEVLISDAAVNFQNLRVEISCPEGAFTIDGFGDGALNAGALSTASVAVSPKTKVSGIQCTGGWGLWCWFVARLAPREFVWERLPTVLVDLIESFVGFRLASGCRLGRNTFALLPYTFKDCCEATYRADHAGCIVGGQFNGRLLSQGRVQGVECAYNKDLMVFQARCETIPGSYSEKSPGVCWEAGVPWRPMASNFDGRTIREQIRTSVQTLLAAELAVMIAVMVMPLALLACASTAFRRPPRRELARMRSLS